MNKKLAQALQALQVPLQAQQFDSAARSCKKLLRKYPGVAEPYIALAQIEHGRGRMDEFLSALVGVSKRRPDDQQLRADLGDALWQHGRTDEAEQVFLAGIRLMPREAGWLRRVAAALQLREQFGQALKLHLQVTELSPDDWLAWFNLGSVCISSKTR